MTRRQTPTCSTHRVIQRCLAAAAAAGAVYVRRRAACVCGAWYVWQGWGRQDGTSGGHPVGRKLHVGNIARRLHLCSGRGGGQVRGITVGVLVCQGERGGATVGLQGELMPTTPWALRLRPHRHRHTDTDTHTHTHTQMQAHRRRHTYKQMQTQAQTDTARCRVAGTHHVMHRVLDHGRQEACCSRGRQCCRVLLRRL